MASMTPHGISRRRLTRGSVDGDDDSADGERNSCSGFGLNETPEEAARAIADALDFLASGTARLGMQDVCELINRASNLTRQFASTRNEE